MWLITTRSFSPRYPNLCKDFALGVSVGLALFFAIISLEQMGPTVGGWPFFFVHLAVQVSIELLITTTAKRAIHR